MLYTSSSSISNRCSLKIENGTKQLYGRRSMAHPGAKPLLYYHVQYVYTMTVVLHTYILHTLLSRTPPHYTALHRRRGRSARGARRGERCVPPRRRLRARAGGKRRTAGVVRPPPPFDYDNCPLITDTHLPDCAIGSLRPLPMDASTIHQLFECDVCTRCAQVCFVRRALPDCAMGSLRRLARFRGAFLRRESGRGAWRLVVSVVVVVIVVVILVVVILIVVVAARPSPFHTLPLTSHLLHHPFTLSHAHRPFALSHAHRPFTPYHAHRLGARRPGAPRLRAERPDRVALGVAAAGDTLLYCTTLYYTKLYYTILYFTANKILRREPRQGARRQIQPSDAGCRRSSRCYRGVV